MLLYRSEEEEMLVEHSSPAFERSQSDQDLTRLSSTSLDKVRHHSSPDCINSDHSGKVAYLIIVLWACYAMYSKSKHDSKIKIEIIVNSDEAMGN